MDYDNRLVFCVTPVKSVVEFDNTFVFRVGAGKKFRCDLVAE